MDKRELLKTAYKNVCDEYTNNKRIMRNESCTILYHLMDHYNLQLQDIADLLGYDIAVMEDVLDTKPYHSFYTEVDDQIRILEKQIKDGKCNEILNLIKQEREPKYLNNKIFEDLFDSNDISNIITFFNYILPIHKSIFTMVNSKCNVYGLEERAEDYEYIFRKYLETRYDLKLSEIKKFENNFQIIMSYDIIDLDNVDFLDPNELNIIEDIYMKSKIKEYGFFDPIDWDNIFAGKYDYIAEVDDDECVEATEIKECTCGKEHCECKTDKNQEDDYLELTYEEFLNKIKKLQEKSPDELYETLKNKTKEVSDMCKTYGINIDLKDLSQYLKNGGAILGAYVKDSKDFENFKNFLKNNF